MHVLCLVCKRYSAPRGNVVLVQIIVSCSPVLLTPAFVACSTNALVLQANTGARRHEASWLSLIETYAVNASRTDTTHNEQCRDLGLRLELS